jgi:transcriptional regulator with XRE-family HTH domain
VADTDAKPPDAKNHKSPRGHRNHRDQRVDREKAQQRTAIVRLARRLTAGRLRAGLTQAALAEACGVTDETISRIERGRYEPAVSTLLRLAEALDLGLDQLAGEGDRPARKAASPASPIVRRLRARIDVLTPRSQRALLALAELLPELPRTSRSAR